jgi:hypothetical protein
MFSQATNNILHPIVNDIVFSVDTTLAVTMSEQLPAQYTASTNKCLLRSGAGESGVYILILCTLGLRIIGPYTQKEFDQLGHCHCRGRPVQRQSPEHHRPRRPPWPPWRRQQVS